MLGGGFKHVLFSPLFLGNDPIWLTCFNWIVNQDLACHISDIDLLGHSVTKFSVIFLCFRCGVHLLFPNPENLPPSWVKSRRFAISGACGYLAAWPALSKSIWPATCVSWWTASSVTTTYLGCFWLWRCGMWITNSLPGIPPLEKQLNR